MPPEPALLVRCWGARGTFPSPGVAFARYGGDTMCFEVLAGNVRVILDAGTGLKALGDAMDARETHILLSHGHIDHVIGLTQFAPFWQAGRPITLWLPPGEPGAAAGLLLEPPLFPVRLAEMPAAIRVMTYAADAPLAVADGLSVQAFAVHHPGGAYGFRIESGQGSVCYVTDHEHGSPLDAALVASIRHADLMIYDSTYTEAEMPGHRGWGHSTWEAGLELAGQAGVPLLWLAHHHPERDDSALDRLQDAADATSFPHGRFVHAGAACAVSRL